MGQPCGMMKSRNSLATNFQRLFALISILLLTSCQTGTDRDEHLQLIIFWSIILSPLLLEIRILRKPGLAIKLMVAQIAGYWYYEIGMSPEMNIRPDILVFLASLA